MKILFWSEFYLPNLGGIEIFSHQLISVLQKRGFEFTVITSILEGSPNEEILNGVQIYRLPLRQGLRGDVRAFKESLSKIIQIKKTVCPDLYHLNTSGPSFFYHLQSMSSHLAPTVFTLHFLISESLQKDGALTKMLSRSDRITAVSYAALERAQSFLPSITPRSSVIYSGLTISNDLFVPAVFNPPKLLCLGRFVREKGYDLAINAFAQLIQTNPDAELILVGDGVEKESLIQLAGYLGIQSHVQFIPALSHQECLALIKEVSAVIIPSRDESFGLVALEAGMSGRPVIASNVGGLPELIIDGVTGILVEPDNANALYEAIRILVDNPSHAAKMGEVAYTHTRKNFSADEMLANYEFIYRTTRDEFIDSLAETLPREMTYPNNDAL